MPSRIVWCLSLLLLTGLGFGQGFKVKDLPKELPFTPPKKWAMVIGANEYTELGKLSFASADAKSFAKVLRERFGFQEESIELITDAEGSSLRPTRTSIEAAVNRQLADPRLNDGDLFIFYFSGHGVGTPKGDFLMPTNATVATVESAGVNVKEIIQKFVKAGLRNVLFIVDACRGGDKNPFGEDLRKLGKQANISVILGCEPGQRSYEYPQLGHGVFTSFLLKALVSKDLESPTTGALWASDVAADVGQKVRNYTERDHPDRPQTPTGWTEKTMDVLLGAFPSKAEGRLKLNDIIANSERLNQDSYVDSLRTFANSLFEQERWADAVETYRAIDALKKLEPGDRFTFALALMRLGRTFERDNQFAILMQGKESNYYSLLARALSSSWQVSMEERMKAASAALERGNSPWTALAAWTGLQNNVPAPDENRFLAEAIKVEGMAKRLRLFFAGRIAFNERKHAEAVAKWREALAVEGDVPSTEFVNSYILQSLLLSGVGDSEAFLRNAAKQDSKAASRWYLLLAQRLKDQGKVEAMMEAIKASLDSNPGSDALLFALRIAGIRCPQIKDRIVREANKQPYAWQAAIAKIWVASVAEDPDGWRSAAKEAEKYNEDAFAVRYEFYRLVDSVLDDYRERGQLPVDKYEEIALQYAGDMAENVDKLGYDAFAWQLMGKFLLSTLQFERMAGLYNLKFGDALDKNALSPIMRTPYMISAMCVGDDARVAKLWTLQGFYQADDADTALAYSVYLAMKGDVARAKQLSPKEPVSGVFAPVQKAFQAYLDCLDGKPADLAKLKEECKDHPEALQLIALAYLQQKDWVRADSLLAQCVFQPLPAYNFVHAKALEAYQGRLLAGKKVEKAAEVAQYTATAFLGTPLYARIHFGAAPGVATFAGKLDFDAREVEVLPNVKAGTLSLSIASTGNVTGICVIGGKARTIEGTVDAYGNVKATMKEGDTMWTMTGKMAQPSAYTRLEVFKTSVQTFLLLDGKGRSRYLFGKVK